MHFCEDRRFGGFSLGADVIFGSPEDCLPVFAEVIVARAEYAIDTDTFDYVAWSPKFDLLPLGHTAPVYEIYWYYSEKGPPRIEFKKGEV